MNTNNSSKTPLIIIICLLATLCAVIVVIAACAVLDRNKKDSAPPRANDTQVSAKVEDTVKDDTTTPKSKASVPGRTDTSDNPQSATSEDVEQYVVNVVRPRYTDITEDTELSESSDSRGKTLYFDKAGTLCKVIYPGGYDNVDYERRYYYLPEGSPIFALVMKPGEEHRFYFLEDELVRYISPQKITTDYPKDQSITDMAQRYLGEAYNY